MVRGGSAGARIVVNIDVQGEPMGKRRRPVLEYGLLRLCIERVVSHRLGSSPNTERGHWSGTLPLPASLFFTGGSGRRPYSSPA